MTTPIDQQIVDGLVVLLQDISVANGYHTDAGERVLSEESRDDIPERALLLEVQDDSEALTEQKLKQRAGSLTVTVTARVPFILDDGITEPRAMCRLVLADIRRAVAKVNATRWIAGVTGLEIGPRTIPGREDGSNYQLASVQIRASFTEQHS